MKRISSVPVILVEALLNAQELAFDGPKGGKTSSDAVAIARYTAISKYKLQARVFCTSGK